MGQRQTSKVTVCSQCGRCWYETCLIFFPAIIKAELSNAEEFLRWISSSLLTLLSRIRKRVSNKHSPTNHLWLKFAAVHLPDTLADSLGCCFTFCFWQFCGRKPLADEKNQVTDCLKVQVYRCYFPGHTHFHYSAWSFSFWFISYLDTEIVISVLFIYSDLTNILVGQIPRYKNQIYCLCEVKFKIKCRKWWLKMVVGGWGNRGTG